MLDLATWAAVAVRRSQSTAEQYACLRARIATDLPEETQELVPTRPGCCAHTLKTQHLACAWALRDDQLALDRAAWLGSVPLLDYCRSNGRPWTTKIADHAAQAGQLACLRYLCASGVVLTTNTLYAAALGGNLDCLRYLREERRLSGGSLAVANAAESGNLACVRYLHEAGFPWHENTTACAAESGSLACLQYLQAQGCPWSPLTLESAARGGSLACMRYAHEHGCLWDGHYTASDAAERGHLWCLIYLHQHGCPCTSYAAYVALKTGHKACARYLCEQGYSETSDSVPSVGLLSMGVMTGSAILDPSLSWISLVLLLSLWLVYISTYYRARQSAV